MAKKGVSGFGFVMLLVVLAIVLMLVAKSWKSLAPTAMQIDDPDMPMTVEDHGEAGAGEALRSGQLPDLNDMRQQTGTHAEQVQEALEAIE